MNLIETIDPKFVKLDPSTNDLDALLRYTERFGKMAVSRLGQTWWARIEMNTNVTGAAFKIDSDGSSSKPHSPLQAVQQCVERMHTALNTLGVQP